MAREGESAKEVGLSVWNYRLKVAEKSGVWTLVTFLWRDGARGKEAVKVEESVDRSKGVQEDVRGERGFVEGPGKQWRRGSGSKTQSILGCRIHKITYEGGGE